MSQFFDISASDVIGAYLQKEQIDADAKVKTMAMQAETQQRTLNAPAIDSAQVAIDSGYVRQPQTQASYWDRIPKGLLYGSGLLLLGAVAYKVAK